MNEKVTVFNGVASITRVGPFSGRTNVSIDVRGQDYKDELYSFDGKHIKVTFELCD